MTSARTQCPECEGQQVAALADLLYAPKADFFRCIDCGSLWHVEKGKNGPASQVLLGPNKLQSSRVLKGESRS